MMLVRAWMTNRIGGGAVALLKRVKEVLIVKAVLDEPAELDQALWCNELPLRDVQARDLASNVLVVQAGNSQTHESAHAAAPEGPAVFVWDRETDQHARVRHTHAPSCSSP